MRNAIQLPNGLIVTTDNAGAIGQKEKDTVHVPDEMVSYFSARVTLLEQWAAGAEPHSILMHNFSGDEVWMRYLKGIHQVFDEIESSSPPISGSTESNIETLQSGIAITMLGEQIYQSKAPETLKWFTYGKPLVGENLLAEKEKVASLKFIYKARQGNIIASVWPVGSKGIAGEIKRIFGSKPFTCAWEPHASAGPSTVVLIGLEDEKVSAAQSLFGKLLLPIRWGDSL